MGRNMQHTTCNATGPRPENRTFQDEWEEMNLEFSETKKTAFLDRDDKGKTVEVLRLLSAQTRV